MKEELQPSRAPETAGGSERRRVAAFVASAAARVARLRAVPFVRENELGLLAAFSVFALHTYIFAAQGGFRGVEMPGRADGHYVYLYARSLAYDGDIDFRNDYALCGDPFRLGIDRGTGHPDNPFYVGPSVFLAPVLAIARLFVAGSPHEGIRMACGGPAAGAALFVGVVCAAATVFLSFVVARRFAEPHAAALAAALFGVSCSFTQYSAVEPSYSHVYSAFSVALLMWVSFRVVESGAWRFVALASLATTLCVLQRVTELGFVVIPVALILASSRWTRSGKLARVAVVGLGGALGLLVTARVYTYLYGSPWVLPQGRHYVHLAHAHPWLLLFAPHGGLFFTTPVAYLALVGWVFAVRRRASAPWALGAGVAFVICLWVSASPLDWHGAGTVGARRLVTVTPLLACFAALALDRALPLVRRHATVLVVAAALAISAAWTTGVAFGTRGGTIAWEGGSQADYYGGGFRDAFALLDKGVGDVAILPAEAAYSARYRLPMTTFRDATTDRYYRRNYRDLSWMARTLDFRDPQLRRTMRGLSPVPEGASFADTGHVVFAASWPYATRLSVVAVAAAPTQLRISIGTWTGDRELGTRALRGPSPETVTVPIDAAFDSGIVELVFTDVEHAGVEIRRIDVDDEATYPPSF